jgi:prepilin-type processing-associated H-X9-DG protein
MPGGFVLACDADVKNHYGQGFNVLFVDARVEWWPASRREEFNALLEAQKQVREKIGKDPGNRKKYLKEYGAKHAPSSGWGARGAPAR